MSAMRPQGWQVGSLATEPLLRPFAAQSNSGF